MTLKLIASTLAIAFCTAVSACLAMPKSEAAEAQILSKAPPPAPVEMSKAAPARGDYVTSKVDIDGAPRYGARQVDCDIRVRRTGNGVAITPVAIVDRFLAGEYHLVLSKSGSSGSSDVTQGGPFSARAGETVKLGETELSLSRRDQYRVVLTLTDNGREMCRREVRS